MRCVWWYEYEHWLIFKWIDWMRNFSEKWALYCAQINCTVKKGFWGWKVINKPKTFKPRIHAKLHRKIKRILSINIKGNAADADTTYTIYTYKTRTLVRSLNSPHFVNSWLRICTLDGKTLRCDEVRWNNETIVWYLGNRCVIVCVCVCVSVYVSCWLVCTLDSLLVSAYC